MNIFTILLDAVTLTVCILATSCGHEVPSIPTPGADVTPAADVTDPAAVATPAQVAPVPTPAIVYVTYYSLTVTRQPNPNKFYTSTGYCLAYSGNTYCWDDGIHTINYGGGVIGYYTYWELSNDNLTTSPHDVALSPTLVNQTFTNHILPGGGSVAAVNGGVPHTVSCTDDGAGNIDCGSFVIDTNQVGL